MKVILVAGARPNFMKIAPLYEEFTKYSDEFSPVIVHAGRHYDFNMSEKFFRDLDLPKPDMHLGIGSGSHAEQTAKAMVKFEKVCINTKPDLVILVGDVNSTMACAVTSKKLLIPVAHVEAGLRSKDVTMPEEINRLITDAVSDFLFTPSEDANENLEREGVDKGKIYLVGNIMTDSLIVALPKASKKNIYKNLGLSRGAYGLLTLHRPSNVDSEERLCQILNILNSISRKIPLIFPMHPRTQKNVATSGLAEKLVLSMSFKIVEPMGYLDFLNLMLNSKFVLTDSGGIQEETTFLKIPCLTLRENTERPITITEGNNELVKPNELKDKTFRILGGDWKEGAIPKSGYALYSTSRKMQLPDFAVYRTTTSRLTERSLAVFVKDFSMRQHFPVMFATYRGCRSMVNHNPQIAIT